MHSVVTSIAVQEADLNGHYYRCRSLFPAVPSSGLVAATVVAVLNFLMSTGSIN